MRKTRIATKFTSFLPAPTPAGLCLSAGFALALGEEARRKVAQAA